MKHVMLDLETAGTAPGSVILSIGAVVFDPESGELGAEFYQVISAKDSIAWGLTIDFDTMTWWAKQSDEAKKVLEQAGSEYSLHLNMALFNLSQYLINDQDPSNEDVCVWGNGASFDNILLQEAFRKIGRKGWNYYNDRCYRTLKNLFPEIKLVRQGTHHNALDDAKSQAVHAITLLCHLRELEQLKERFDEGKLICNPED